MATASERLLDGALSTPPLGGPQVKPVLSYVVLSLNLLVYSYGILIALTQGGDASNEYFLSLAKVNENVMNGEYYRCAALPHHSTIRGLFHVRIDIFQGVCVLAC